MVDQQGMGEEAEGEGVGPSEGIWWPPGLLGRWMQQVQPQGAAGGEGEQEGPPTCIADVDLRRVVARLRELTA